MKLLRLPEVLEKRAKGRSAHYEDIKNGLFTKPVKIGVRASGWPLHEVEALIAHQISGAPPSEVRKLVRQLHADRNTARHQDGQ